MSKQQQTKKEVKEMAIPISLCGGAKQARSPRPRFLGGNSIENNLPEFWFVKSLKIPF